MVKEIARVIENKGKKALVKIIRQSACSKCDQDCLMAGDSHEIEEMDIEVNNPVGAAEGKTVRLEMGEKPLVFASMIVYLLPLLGLITGYFAGSWVSTLIIFSSAEITGIIGAFLFLLLSFLLVRMIDSRLRRKRVFQPEITDIID